MRTRSLEANFVNFFGLGTPLELFFKNQGSSYKIPDRRLISQKSMPFCKISELNRNNELFQQRKSHGLGPQAMDHCRVTRSTVDQQGHRWVDAEAWWRAHRSLASSHSGAWELTGEGTKERGQCGEPILVLTRARVAVCGRATAINWR
jgi:hypothetical protein